MSVGFLKMMLNRKVFKELKVFNFTYSSSETHVILRVETNGFICTLSINSCSHKGRQAHCSGCNRDYRRSNGNVKNCFGAFFPSKSSYRIHVQNVHVSKNMPS